MASDIRTRIRLALGVCAIAFSCIFTLALPKKAEAAVYKCTDTSGNVSYNQIPCANEENAETVLSTKSTNKADVDCRIANNFARQIAERMRLGQSSGTVFDSYGGIDAVPGTSVGIISYVYSHKGNLDTGAQRITALSAARCSTGSYGPVNCDDFPGDFIAKLGGCDRASMNTTAGPLTTAPSDQTTTPTQEGTTHALGARTSGNQKPSTVNCQQDMQAPLSELLEQMRAGQSNNKQGQSEGQEKELREQLTNC